MANVAVREAVIRKVVWSGHSGRNIIPLTITRVRAKDNRVLDRSSFRSDTHNFCIVLVLNKKTDLTTSVIKATKSSPLHHPRDFLIQNTPSASVFRDCYNSWYIPTFCNNTRLLHLTVSIRIRLGEFRRLILAALKSEDSKSLSLITIELFPLEGSNAAASSTQIRLFLL